MATIPFTQRLKIPVYDDPEQVQYASLEIDTEKCIKCGLCVTACAFGLIEIGGNYRTDYLEGTVRGKLGIPRQVTALNGLELCIGCLTCSAACPKGLISIKHPFRADFCWEKLHQAPEMTPPKRY